MEPNDQKLKGIDKNQKVVSDENRLGTFRDLQSNDSSEEASEDAALNYLASILVEGCLELQNDAAQSNGEKASSDILPRIHEGTS